MTRKLILSATALLLCMFAFFNCNKDSHSEQEIETGKSSLTIPGAQSWYTNQSNQQSGSVASRPNKNKIGRFTPQWGKAITSGDKSYDVVECPLRFDNKPGFTISAKGNSKDSIHGSTRLLILKNKKTGTIRSALMNIYTTSGNDASGVTYSKKGNHFSGYIFFTDVNGEFINGWQYEDGRIIKQSKKTLSSSNTASKAMPPIDDDDCETYETRWYEQDCEYYTDGSSECTDWFYIGSTYETYCTGGGGGGGSDGGYENIVYGEETFNTGRSVIYPGGQHTIGVTYYTKVQYTYDYDSQTFLDITPFQPTASPQSQFFWDDNGNLATLTVTCFPWSFSSTPLTNKSFFAVWDFVANWLFSYTTGNVPLTFTEGASRVVAVP